MLPFHKAAENDFLAVNDMIMSQLHSDVELVENIGEYIVEGGGKRLRPLVVLLSALACGFNKETDDENQNPAKDEHIRLACIIEFIHTATLLHDDVVDTSELRRGRPTANAKWGNSPTVLVGDFLYSRAFQMLVKLGSMDIMKMLADTTNSIAEGEVQQLINAGDPDVSEQNYLDVINKKTAILFEAATAGGAEIAKQNKARVEAFAKYGHHLGMAFQLQDDVLDYTGNAEEMGKNVGDDLAEGKPTLPLIFAMRQGNAKNGNKIQADLISNAIRDCDASKISEIVKIVQSCGGLEYTQKLASEHSKKAKDALSGLAESRYKTALFELADFSLSRSY